MKKSFITGTLLLSACVSVAEQDQPALIVTPSERSHAELVSAISHALQGAPVTVAKDALTKDSTLFIERVPARDATGQRLSGRDFEKPDQFQLVKQGAQCVLVHSRTGARTVLTNTSCAAI
jgi:hypothetical protein